MALGHPKGLFPLFFTEMWERLAFYTMVGILLLYTTDSERGGLGLTTEKGNEIYGLYLAFVYFTPFLGGMIADRFTGYRLAVALGGVTMAAGLLLMGVPGYSFFVIGLIGLIIGVGLLKPNISVMVGNLYGPGDPKRDQGFNIFYMGINVGALMATLIVAPLMRNMFNWLWAFRAAGCGVLIAVVILLTHWKLLAAADRQPERSPEDAGFGEILLKIIGPALLVGMGGYFLAIQLDITTPRPAVCGFLAGMLPVILFFVRLGLTANQDERPGLLALLPIFVAGGAFFMILHLNGSAMTQWARDETDRQAWGPSKVATLVNPWSEQEALPSYYVNAAEDVPRPDPRSLVVVDNEGISRMYGQQRMDQAAVAAVAGIEGVAVAEIEDGGNQPESWNDRACNVYADGVVQVNNTTDSHGAPIISVSIPDGARRDRRVVFLRDVDGQRIPTFLIDADIHQEIYDGYRQRFGHPPPLLPPGQFLAVVSPEVYQSWNPLFVILLTPLVVGFFQWRVIRGKPVPTAHKLLYGTILTTVALLLMALAGVMAKGGTIKVSDLWLASFYLVVTAGELCLSPMGLSLVTKLSPRRLVGLAMGGWFMATAFGNNLSGFFGGIQHRMDPMNFFLLLAGLMAVVALFIYLVLPRLDAAIQKYGA